MKGLTRSKRRLAARVQLTEEDRELLAALRREMRVIRPWLALGLHRGWLTGNVASPGSYTWQGAILLGIDPEEADSSE